ncbi:MAG: accessory gene regulator B family protein [Oscillospiraceae bacterium]|nr:accessory gene regulator B family protein [Oscillospiraceae bacterium]
MKSIVIRMVDFFCKNKSINASDRAIYEYGAEAFLTSLIDVIITIIVGLCFGQVSQAILYLIVFFGYRQFSGGYHAESHIMCKSVSTILLLTVMIFLKTMGDNFNSQNAVLVSCFFFSFIIALFFSPVEHYNKPLTNEHKSKNRKICIFLNILGFVACYIVSYISLIFAMMILCSFINASFLIIVAKIIKRRNSNEKSQKINV